MVCSRQPSIVAAVRLLPERLLCRLVTVLACLVLRSHIQLQPCCVQIGYSADSASRACLTLV